MRKAAIFVTVGLLIAIMPADGAIGQIPSRHPAPSNASLRRENSSLGFAPSSGESSERDISLSLASHLKTVSSSGPDPAGKDGNFALSLASHLQTVSEDGELSTAGNPPPPHVFPEAGPAPHWTGGEHLAADNWSAGSCDAGARLRARVDYLLWWSSGADYPVLATSSPNGTPQDIAGVLGQDTTNVLFGGGTEDDGVRSGGLYSLGVWLDSCQCYRLDVSYLSLEDQSDSFTSAGTGLDVVARPFDNVTTDEADARFIVFPGLVTGTLNIQAQSDFQTYEVNLSRQGVSFYEAKVDLLVGYRRATLDDHLLISESTLSVGGATEGATFELFDRFDAENEFNGAQIGMIATAQMAPCWSSELISKVAFGSTRSRVSIAGQTIATPAGGNPMTTAGGLLAQPSQIDDYHQNEHATMGEFGATLRRHFPIGLTATLGYRFIYVTDVARAAEQINTNVDVAQFNPGMPQGAVPAFQIDTTSYWAQGLTFGLEGSF